MLTEEQKQEIRETLERLFNEVGSDSKLMLAISCNDTAVVWQQNYTFGEVAIAAFSLAKNLTEELSS